MRPLVILLVLFPSIAAAQTTREPAAVLGVGGVLYSSAIFGDDDPKPSHSTTPTVGLQIRGPRKGSTAFTFEVMAQTNSTMNPHYVEHFAPVYFMAGGQTGRGTYVRWSGGFTFIGGPAPIFGVAIGRERDFGPKHLAGAEVVFRIAGVTGAAGIMAGLQIPVGFR
jgi:hypothetical protein